MPLLLYLEDAPVSNGVPAAGLSKAFNATLKGMVSDSLRLCIVQTHQFIEDRHFLKECSSQPSWVSNRIDWFLSRLYARLPWFIARRAASMHGRLIAWRLIRALPGLLPPRTRLFAPIGIDPLTLVRAETLARNLSAGLEPYLVDDILNHPANRHWRAALTNDLSILLRKAKKIYTITDGLGNLVLARHGLQSHTLNLVAESFDYSAIKLHTSHPGAFAFYLGSINHLYAQGLLHLIQQVGNIRELTGQDLKIRICSSQIQVEKELGTVPAWVIVGTITDDLQLYCEMQSAIFCFLPYSFETSAKNMIESSFPSKMIAYLAHANAILVFSPNTAVPYQLLASNNLPYVCSSSATLREQLLNLVNRPPSLARLYKGLLEQNFSVSAMWLILGIK